MTQVRLERDWTDQDGNQHPVGALIEVDAGTLAELQAQGIVADPDGHPHNGTEPDGGWIGPGAASPSSG